MNIQAYWYWLTNIEGLGKKTIDKLLNYYQTPMEVYGASSEELGQVLRKFCGLKGVNGEQVIRRIRAREPLDYYGDKIERLKGRGIGFMTITDEDYPDKLRHIYDSPKTLYVLGTLPDFNEPTVAIVGARRCTAYGAHMAEKVSRELTQAGLHVISGMARGIDGLAHKGAIEAINKGSEAKTVAVLGCGVNICYPKEHAKLYSQVRQCGAIISEYPMDAQPIPANFPLRNRIISGLSDGVFVVEAKRNSGSLITAHYGLEQGKDIYALPGRTTDKTSLGSNQLIKAGAKIVLDTDDILEEFGLDYRSIHEQEAVLNLESDEASLYKLVSYDPISTASLSQVSDIPYDVLTLTLLKLELKGLIRHLPNKQVVRK